KALLHPDDESDALTHDEPLLVSGVAWLAGIYSQPGRKRQRLEREGQPWAGSGASGGPASAGGTSPGERSPLLASAGASTAGPSLPRSGRGPASQNPTGPSQRSLSSGPKQLNRLQQWKGRQFNPAPLQVASSLN